VPDSLFAALQAELTDEQLLELTYITALYLQHAVMSRALRTEYDDRPEPVVEVGVVVEGGPVVATAYHDAVPEDRR
jgi:hypothetical protein